LREENDVNATPSRGWTRWLPALCLVLVFSAADVKAQAREFGIPEGELKAALEAFVATTGQQLVYKVDDLKGLRSKGAQGRMTPDQALELLLEGTKLRLRRDPSGAAVIFLSESATGGTDSQTPSSAKPDQTVVITARGISHLAERNRTGTRSDTNPLELAQSVTTVKRQLIDEQQATGLTDVVRNVAGITYQPGESGTGYLMRGLVASVMTNGSLVESAGNRIQRPAVAMQSVEVVRGPESIVGGAQAGYGGVINVITKGADGERVREGQVRFGSQGLKALSIDVGGSFVDDKGVNYRLVAERERRGRTPVGYLGSRHDYVAPSFSWQNRNTGTNLAVDAVYSKAFSQAPEVVYTNVPPSDSLAPRRTGPADIGLKFDERQFSVTLAQKLGERWSFRWKSDFTEDSSFNRFAVGRHNSLSWPVMTVLVSGDGKPVEGQANAHRAEFLGRFSTGPIAHRLVVLMDQRNSRSSGVEIVEESSYTENLVTGEILDTSELDGLPFAISFAGTRDKESGFMVQDQWTWGKFAGQIAARYARTVASEEGGEVFYRFRKVLPTVGLVYRMTPDLSLYASRAQTFRTNFGRRFFEGGLLPPETGLQWEAGVKSLLLDKKLALTAAVYRLEQRNVAGPDLVNPGDFAVLMPRIFSKGGEVEASGSISNWSWRLSAAYNDIRDADGGRPYFDRSRVQATAYLRYAFGSDSNSESETWVSADAQYIRPVARELPNYPGVLFSPRETVVLNLSAGYDAVDWFVTGGVRNLFDQRLYQVGRLVIDQPRGVSVTAGVRF
jgi:iron complex outermembrane receptor protein